MFQGIDVFEQSAGGFIQRRGRPVVRDFHQLFASLGQSRRVVFERRFPQKRPCHHIGSDVPPRRSWVIRDGPELLFCLYKILGIEVGGGDLIIAIRSLKR